MATTVPQAKFGLAFNESSGACLTRSEGNDQTLRDVAVRNAQELSCGHTFVVIVQNAYPIYVMNAIRNVPEVCSIFCATANPVEVVVAQSEQGRGGLGVIDGSSPKGIEGQADIAWRRDLLRRIGYKR
ncbi:MAG: adenosine-specific kinase [Candidatus Sulfotelmatobacter sp.]